MNINATLFGQMITFALFIGVTMRYIWPQVMAAMEARRAEIQQALQEAAQGRESLRLAKLEAEEILEDARQQGKETIAAGEAQKRKLVDEAAKEAKLKQDEILQAGHKQLLIDREAMYLALKKEMAAMVLSISERLMSASVDTKVHQNLIKQYLDEN